MSKLILIRGLPGSGKSTLAKAYIAESNNSIHLEADMYFINQDGQYCFDAAKLKKAHEWCLDTTRILLPQYSSVVVSNTFTTIKELKPYLNLVPITDIIIVEKLDRYGSVHNVPVETIEKMKARWENADPIYKILQIYT